MKHKLIRAPLTNDGQGDHDEVEDVPAHGEVVVAKRQHLQHALGREDDDEEHVDPVEDGDLLLALIFCLHHHGDHVQADQHHDQNVKGLLGRQVKD